MLVRRCYHTASYTADNSFPYIDHTTLCTAQCLTLQPSLKQMLSLQSAPLESVMQLTKWVSFVEACWYLRLDLDWF